MSSQQDINASPASKLRPAIVDEIDMGKLCELAKVSHPQCVSIYMPTHRQGDDTRQDPLRLKGLLSQAEETLIARGMRGPEARTLMEPASELLNDGQFWSHQADGLALFVTSDGRSCFRLPRRFQEFHTVGTRFHLTPLVPVINEDVTFLVLAISPKRVRLLRGSRDTIAEVEVRGLPKDYEELGKYIDTERLLQFHTRAAPTGTGSSDRAAVFHGQGVGTDDAQWKKQLSEFCQLINKQLQPVLSNLKTPLVLAADRSLLPLYRETDSYQHTLQEAIVGNPDEKSDKQLGDTGWPIARERSIWQKTEMLAAFDNAAVQDRGSNKLEQVMPSAFDGRIATLLIADASQVWGSYDEVGRETTVHTERRQDDVELINLAAVTSLLKGAELYSYDRDEMPGRSLLAATFRY